MVLFEFLIIYSNIFIYVFWFYLLFVCEEWFDMYVVIDSGVIKLIIKYYYRIFFFKIDSIFFRGCWLFGYDLEIEFRNVCKCCMVFG